MDDMSKGPNYLFYDEPAIIESLGDTTIVRTAYGKFCVFSLTNIALRPNDILWTSFTVEKKEENKVQMPGNQYYYRANAFQYHKIDSAKVIIPANVSEFESYLTDNYKEKINLSVLYKTYVDSLLFFGFSQESTAKSFEYELFLNPQVEHSNGYPTLYIRSRRARQPRTLYSKTIFAFEMTDFLNYYGKTFPGQKTVRFNLKYYAETKDGKDVYREFLSNPLSWRLE